MKNLANCTPREFFAQTVKIKKSVEVWLKETDVINIRKIKPIIPDGATNEEKRASLEKQARENLSKMFDAIMEEHPTETLELLALLCFVDPKDVDTYPMCDYLGAIGEMLGNQDVIGFFTSLVQLGRITG